MVDGCRSKLINIVRCAAGQYSGPVIVHQYTSELFSSLKNKLISYSDDSTFLSEVPSQGVRVTVAEFLNSDLSKVSEWCDLWGMNLNTSKTKTMMRPQVTNNASPVTPINYWRNCAERVWWPWYFGNDIWFRDHFRAASSLGFQNSTAWYLEEFLASIPWYIVSWEVLSVFCPASFGKLLCSVVLGCRYTP